MFGQMEKKLQEMHTKEDDILSHKITRSRSKIRGKQPILTYVTVR